MDSRRGGLGSACGVCIVAPYSKEPNKDLIERLAQKFGP